MQQIIAMVEFLFYIALDQSQNAGIETGSACQSARAKKKKKYSTHFERSLNSMSCTGTFHSFYRYKLCTAEKTSKIIVYNADGN